MALIDNIVSYWKFDVNSSTQIDSVGSNNGSVTGATFTNNGKINNGYDYDGINDNIIVADSPGISPTDDFSISVWVKISNLNNTFQQIMNKGNATSLAGSSYEFVIDNNNQIKFCVYNNSTSSCSIFASPVVDTWYHLVGTYGNDGTILYVNNVAQTAGSDIGTINDISTPLGFGSSGTNGLSYFKGIIDEAALWNKVLTSKEVAESYNGGSGLTYPFTTTSKNNAIFHSMNF